MKLGNKVRKIRNLRGFSQEYVAQKLNISTQAYGKIETNHTKLDEERLQQIAEILGVTTEDIELFDEEKLFIHNNNPHSQHHAQAQTNSQAQFYNKRDVHVTYAESDKIVNLLQDLIQQKNEEIAFLRQQLADALALLKK
jgi:transcriptional regulator with XRE-family HTH domain